MRAARLCGQARPRDPQARGQPAPPGQPRAQLREGPGDDQPDQRSRADPAPAAPEGAAGRRRLGAGELGPRARRVRRADARGVRRRAAQRRLLLRRPPRARTASPIGSSRPGAATATTRTPTCARRAAAPATASGAGTDRPSPDYANARFVLLCSAHLESGHYFNPHAQRLIEAQAARREDRGDRSAAVEHRLARGLLAAHLAGHGGGGAAGDRARAARGGPLRPRVRAPLGQLAHLHASPRARDGADVRQLHRASSSASTPATRPSSRRRESGVPAATIVEVAREIAAAAPAFASHIWRAAAAGNLHGWQVTRSLWLLNVLTGSVGTEGGVSPNAWNKFIPAPWRKPPPHAQWNELSWPREYPLAHNEMSFLYPHFLLDGRGRQPVLFTRVLNPVWTYPDGYSWLRALRDERRGRAARRAHPDLVGDRVVGGLRAADGARARAPRHPLLRDPRGPLARLPPAGAARGDGAAGPAGRVHLRGQPGRGLGGGRVLDRGLLARRPRRLARHPALLRVPLPARARRSRSRSTTAGCSRTRCPGLPEKAAAEGLDPLGYMRRYGAVEISRGDYAQHETEVDRPGRHRGARR